MRGTAASWEIVVFVQRCRSSNPRRHLLGGRVTGTPGASVPREALVPLACRFEMGQRRPQQKVVPMRLSPLLFLLLPFAASAELVEEDSSFGVDTITRRHGDRASVVGHHRVAGHFLREHGASAARWGHLRGVALRDCGRGGWLVCSSRDPNRPGCDGARGRHRGFARSHRQPRT